MPWGVSAVHDDDDALGMHSPGNVSHGEHHSPLAADVVYDDSANLVILRKNSAGLLCIAR